jgi:hypothetical protein
MVHHRFFEGSRFHRNGSIGQKQALFPAMIFPPIGQKKRGNPILWIASVKLHDFNRGL